MSRLSSPESVLNRIGEIYGKIEELFCTVDEVAAFRDRFEAAWREAVNLESGMKERMGRFAELAGDFDEALARINHLGADAENELTRITTEFGYEKESLRAAISDFQARCRRLEEREEDAGRQRQEVLQEIKTFLATADHRLEERGREFRLDMAIAFDENSRRIDEEMAAVRLEAETGREELFGLEDRLEEYRRRLDRRLRRSLDELEERRSTFQETTTSELHTRIAAETGRLNDMIEQALASLDERMTSGSAHIAASLSFMEAEKEAAHQRQAEQETALARMDGKIEKLIETGQNQISQAITSSHTVIRREADHMAAFISNAEKEVRQFKNVVKGFKDRMSEYLNREAETLGRLQSEFQERIARELYERMSEEIKGLRDVSDREMRALRREHKDIEEMHQGLEDALAQASRAVTGKTAFFTSQLNNLIVDTQKDLSGILDKNALRLEAHATAISALETRAADALDRLEKETEQAMTRARGKTNALLAEIHASREKENAAFMENLSGTLSRKFAADLEKIRTDASAETKSLCRKTDRTGKERQNRLTAQFNAYIEQNRTRMERLDARLDKAAGQIVQKAHNAGRDRHNLLRQEIKTALEKQDETLEKIPALEQRLQKMETAFMALQDHPDKQNAAKRKGLLSFIKK